MESFAKSARKQTMNQVLTPVNSLKAQVDRVVTFNGHKTALSNIFPSELKVNGETHSFVEHACQLTKVLHLGDIKS